MSLFASKPAVRHPSQKRAFAWRSGAAARCLAKIAVVGAGALLIGQSAQAATYNYIGLTTGVWSNSAVWNPAGVPTTGDIASFTGSASQAVLLGGNQAALDLSLTATGGTTSIRASVAGQVLSLGTGGIQFGSTQTDLGGSGTAAMAIALMGNQSWTGSGTGGLIQLNNGAAVTQQSITNGTASAVTLTFDGVSTGGKTIFGAIDDGVSGGTTALTLSTTGGFGSLVLLGTNTYSGGTTFNQGFLDLRNNTALGTGALTITNSSVTKSISSGIVGGVTLTNNNPLNFNIGVNASTIGAILLGGSQSIDFGTGAITLGAATTFSFSNAGLANTYTFGGAITSAFGLTLQSSAVNNLPNSLLVFNGANTGNSSAAPITISGSAPTVKFGNTSAVPAGVGAVVLNGGAIAVGTGTAFPTIASFLTDTRITKTSGAIALTGDSSESFTAAPNSNISLGAANGSVVRYTGTLTPFIGSGYNIGGGGGTIVFTGANAFTGTRGLATNSGSNIGNVSFGAGGTTIITGQNTFNGAVNIGAGTLEVSSLNKVVGGTATSNLGAPTTAANGTISVGYPGQIFSELRYTGTGETTDRTLNFNGFSGATTGLDASGSGAVVFGGAYTQANASNNRFVSLRGINTGANTITAGLGAGVVASAGGFNLVKVQRGNWTLTGTNNFAATNASTTGLQINGGTLTADYTTNPSILGVAGTNLTLGGGTLAMVYNGAGTATQSIGNGATTPLTTLTANTGQSNISVTGNGTPGSAVLTVGSNFTRNGGTFLNFNLLNSGQAASTATLSNNVVVGSSNVAAFTVTDTAGGDFATITGGQIAKLNAATALPTVTGSNATNYLLTGSQTQSGATAISTLRIAPTASGSTLDLGANNGFTTGLGAVSILKDGANAFTVTGTVSLAASALVLSNFGTGALTVAVPATTGSNTLTKTGPGLVDLTAANSYTGATNIFGGVLRASNGVFAGAGNIVLNTGGILELGGFGDFTRALGTGGGQIQWTNGDGGFSAYAPANNGVTRFVTLTNSLGAAGGQLVWGSTSGNNNIISPPASTNFVKDGFALLLSSSTSNTVVNFTNPIDFVNLPRTVQVGDGTGAVDAILSGTLSSSDNSGGLYKAGAGTLKVTGTNTFTGGTAVTAGTVSGPTVAYSTGNVVVNAGATADYTQNTTTTYGASITGSGSVTVGANPGGVAASTGTITYTGVDNVSGGTSVKAGTLLLNHTGGGALTGPVNVATGGTVGLGSSSQIAPTSNVSLTGGTLAANGNSDGAASGGVVTVQGLGTLQVGDPAAAATASTLDFGDPAGATPVTLTFGDSSSLTWNGTLTLTNYTDGTDQLFIGQTSDLTTAQLSAINFNGLQAAQDANGKIIFAAAPEPSGWASMIIGVGVLGGIIARRRRSTVAQAA